MRLGVDRRRRSFCPWKGSSAVGCSSPRVVHDAGELTWAPSASVLVMPHASHQPPAPDPPQKRAGSSDAARRHGLIWDHTVFHVVASCRANPAMVAPSKRNCRISQRIARTPKRARGAHTEWFCSMKVTIRQACSRHIQRRLNHRNLAGTPAQGASITSTTVNTSCLVGSAVSTSRGPTMAAPGCHPRPLRKAHTP